jgi:hypothetical protein
MSALRAGDVLLQLNGHRLQTCADLGAALREALDNDVAPLFLIRRGAQTVAVVAQWPAPQPAPAAVPAIVPPATPTARASAVPTVAPSPVPTTVPTPLSRADADAARVLLAQLVALGHELQDRQPLPMAQPWAQQVDRLRHEYDTQRARGAHVGVLDPILGYYEAVVQILRYKEVALRGRRNIRARAEIVLEYHGGSEVSGWLRRYPFLQPSVIEAAEPFVIPPFESNGLWAPDRAVALLLERAVSEGITLEAQLAAGSGR